MTTMKIEGNSGEEVGINHWILIQNCVWLDQTWRFITQANVLRSFQFFVVTACLFRNDRNRVIYLVIIRSDLNLEEAFTALEIANKILYTKLPEFESLFMLNLVVDTFEKLWFSCCWIFSVTIEF